MSDRLVIIVPCSGDKLDYDPIARAHADESPYVPAGELYVGGFHAYARKRAEAIADAVLVLSAWKGLIELDFPMSPYDISIDHHAAIWTRPSLVAHQAKGHGLFDPDTVVVSWCPAAYTRELTRSIPKVVPAFANSRGIGDQRGRIARATRDDLLAGITTPAQSPLFV